MTNSYIEEYFKNNPEATIGDVYNSYYERVDKNKNYKMILYYLCNEVGISMRDFKNHAELSHITAYIHLCYIYNKVNMKRAKKLIGFEIFRTLEITEDVTKLINKLKCIIELID